MGPCGPLHTKLLRTPTSGLAIFTAFESSFENNPLKCIHKVVDYYNERLRDNAVDERLHDAYRTLLCYQYQLLVNSEILPASDYLNDTLVENLRKNLCTCRNSKADSTTFHDISVLQIFFYLDTATFQLLFSEALRFIKNQPTPGDPKNHAIIDIFLDSAMLIRKFDTDDEKTLVIPAELLQIMENWISITCESALEEWKPLVSVFLKGMTLNPQLVTEIWSLIVKHSSTESVRKKWLTFLCSMIDDLLAQLSADAVTLNITHCMNEKILLLLSDHMSSTFQLCRMQAQYTLIKMVGFLRNHTTKIPDVESKKIVPPFVLCKDPDFDVEVMMNNYFTLMKILERQVADISKSETADVETLVKIASSQELSFNRIWLRCLFTRLLAHKNSTVVKRFTMLLLAVDLKIFDDGFITLLVETLNNEVIYDDTSPQPLPRILRELPQLFVNAEESGLNVSSRVIITASKLTWSPIALFYLLEYLGNPGITQVKHNVWTAEELEALLITSEQTSKQMRMMKVPTQTNVLKCITLYAQRPLDFPLLGRILSSVDVGEVLVRGNATWESLVDYLKSNMEEANIVQDVSALSKQLLTHGTHSRDIKALGILIVLMCDTENFLLKSSITPNLLCPLFMPILNASSIESSDSSSILKALQMITCLGKLSPRNDDDYVMFIFGFARSILDFIISSLWSKWPQSYEEAVIHVGALQTIVQFGKLSNCFKTVMSQLLQIGEEDTEKIVGLIADEKTPVIRAWYALKILHLTGSGCKSVFTRPIPKFSSKDATKQIVSECYGLVGRLYERHLESVEADTFPKSVRNRLMLLARTESIHAIEPIARTLRTALTRIGNDIFRVVEDVANVCWKVMWTKEGTPEFWVAARGLSALLLSDRFVERRRSQRFTCTKIKKLLSDAESSWESKFIFFSAMQSMPSKSILQFHDPILTAFLQLSSNPSKSTEVQTCYYISQRYVIDLRNRSSRSVSLGLGVYTEVAARSVLIGLILAMIQDCKREVVGAYVPRITSILAQNTEDYEANSDTHRITLRLMQVLLLLRNDSMYDYLLQSLVNEKDQLSVRMMKQWILVLFYLRNPAAKDDFWQTFSAARDERPASRMALISIVYHVAQLLTTDKMAYIEKALGHILYGCFSENPKCKWFSQAMLSKFLEMCGDGHETLREAVDQCLKPIRHKGNAVKMLDHSYFNVFNPEVNYNLQMIFNDIPRVGNILMDECIRPEVFEAVLERPCRFGVPIFNGRSSKSGSSRGSKQQDGDRVGAKEINGEGSTGGQKGIARRSAGSKGAAPSTSTASRQNKMADAGLIVIASLVEGFSNLGALAATAKKFGAVELVLKNKRCMENKDFQGMSLAAEESIPIVEVKTYELREYLVGKKAQGWKIVGAIKTDKSVSLLEMQFDKKTVLVLSNEKTGIPADLVQLMDVCVGVHQGDVFEPLNVQVDGAICMWQYAQQHLF